MLNPSKGIENVDSAKVKFFNVLKFEIKHFFMQGTLEMNLMLSATFENVNNIM